MIVLTVHHCWAQPCPTARRASEVRQPAVAGERAWAGVLASLGNLPEGVALSAFGWYNRGIVGPRYIAALVEATSRFDVSGITLHNIAPESRSHQPASAGMRAALSGLPSLRRGYPLTST